MPLVTFFSVLERPRKTIRGLQQPLLVRRGIMMNSNNDDDNKYTWKSFVDTT